MQIEIAYSRAIVTFSLSGATYEVSTIKMKFKKFGLENAGQIDEGDKQNSTCAMPRQNFNLYR